MSFQLPAGMAPEPERPEIVFQVVHHHAPEPSVVAETGRAVGRAMSPLVTWAIILTVISLAGGGAAFGGFGGMFGLGGWNGKQPFACDGNDRVVAKKVTATFTVGSAITVDGNCRFECEDCNIKAPVGAAVRGNGQAVFVNGAIDGTETIADVSVNGRFEVRGQTQLTGGKPKKSGNGKLTGLPPALLATDPVKAPPAKR